MKPKDEILREIQQFFRLELSEKDDDIITFTLASQFTCVNKSLKENPVAVTKTAVELLKANVNKVILEAEDFLNFLETTNECNQFEH